MEAYGNKATTIKRLRKGNSNNSKVDGGILQRNNIHLAVCAPGRVTETLQQLSDAPETAKQKVKFLFATDGREIQAEDLTSGDTLACAFSDLDEHFTFFFELAGISTVKEIKESAFDIKATSRLNKLYLELLRHNPDWATAERREEMNHFMARLIFCFFAEDTNIFRGDNLFTDTVEKMSAPDGSNVHEIIEECFRSMDTNYTDKDEADIRVWARSFPYVNGQLFSGSRECPRFTKIGRVYLQHVGKLNWKQINPDIFGSMIQAVADEEERSSLGMHYTSVPNILKVLNPLFLDELREQLDAAAGNSRKLANLRRRISRIRVFDPACGSGNFLVIAYKQLRKIEYAINQRRDEATRQSDIPLTNFRGIELKHFSAEIARLALVIAEYQCDELYLGQQHALAVFLPLDSQNWIICGNALRLNWLTVFSPKEKEVELSGDTHFSGAEGEAGVTFEDDGGETFICGNPPYVGATVKAPKGASKELKARLKKEAEERKADIKHVFANRTKTWRSLDYVAGWFMKAIDYSRHSPTEIAFVSTNSICQGLQVPTLWPLIFNAQHYISFSYTSFTWANLASYNAGVTVCIVGLSSADNRLRRLFTTEDNGDVNETRVVNINAYLVAHQDIIVNTSSGPKSNLQSMQYGSKPADGGGLIIDPSEYLELKATNSKAITFIRKFLGSQDSIKGKHRYCLWVKEDRLQEAKNIAFVKSRMDKVREFRLDSSKSTTVKSADRSHAFQEIRQSGDESLSCIPIHSSETRPYLPFTLERRGVIIANSAFALFNPKLWNLAIFGSKLHIVWIATVCGKIKEGYRFSNTLGWNTFPLPPLTTKNKADLTACAEEILLARERHFPATIADLYAPDKMPEDLQRAHDRNDEVLERIYIGRRFKNDTERLETLFGLYTEMTGGGGN